MDAEIWSYADTKNGRLILRGLTALLIVKEFVVAALPVFGLPAIDPLFASAQDLLPIPPALAGFVLKFALVLIVNAGFSWARVSLGLIYLIMSAYTAALILKEPLEAIPFGVALTLANAFLGLVMGLVLLFSAQLKAHLWHLAATRLIIPIPGDDEPGERPSRRAPRLGESLLASIRRLFGLLFVLAVLGLVAYLQHWTDPLLKLLGQ